MKQKDIKEILRLRAKIEKALHGEPFWYCELALKDLCKDFGFLRGTPITDRIKNKNSNGVRELRGIKKGL